MKLRSDLVVRRVGQDYVIVEPGLDMVDMSKVYTLNETTAWLWDELQNKEFVLADVVTLLLDRYEVEHDVAENDANELLVILQNNNLITT